MADKLPFTGPVEFNKTVTAKSTVSINGLMTATNINNSKGTDIANNTDAVAIATSDHGKTFLCALNNAAKTVTLPAVVAADVGMQIKIIQTADLVGSGVLKFDCASGATYSVNSYAIGVNGGRPLAATRPADANNRITITGAGSNSAWGIGSVATFTCVAAGEWHFALHAEPLGTGNDAIAFSTF